MFSHFSFIFLTVPVVSIQNEQIVVEVTEVVVTSVEACSVVEVT